MHDDDTKCFQCLSARIARARHAGRARMRARTRARRAQCDATNVKHNTMVPTPKSRGRANPPQTSARATMLFDDDDREDTRMKRMMRVATLTTAGLLLGAVATASTSTAIAGGGVRAMLGGADARATGDMEYANAQLGAAKWRRSPAVEARQARRERERKAAVDGKIAGAGGDRARDFSTAAFNDGTRTMSRGAAYDMADVVNIPRWMMERVGYHLHRFSGFAYGVDNNELVGNVRRSQWRREHLEARKNHRMESELGADGESLTTPIMVIYLGDLKTSAPNANIGKTDADRVEALVKQLAHAHGTQAVKELVRLTPGVNVHDWPEKENVAQYALKSVLENKADDMEFSKLPWLSFYASRDSDGHFRDKFAEERHLEHHIGCLFAHMFQFQLAYDSGYKDTYMLESDAWDPSLLALPFSAYDTLVENAPQDYDIIFIDKPLQFDHGEPVGSFEDPESGDEMLIFHLKHKSPQAGLSAALVSERFYPKFFKHVGGFGADMIDAMLKAELCVDSAFDSEGVRTGFGAGNAPALKCYWALPKKIMKELLSPDGKHHHDDNDK